jgi:hypothetical protein
MKCKCDPNIDFKSIMSSNKNSSTRSRRRRSSSSSGSGSGNNINVYNVEVLTVASLA